ncbi:caspase domain-containing protein [Chloroflexota bacterium]
MKKILSILVLLALIAAMGAPVMAAAQDNAVMSMEGLTLELKPMSSDLAGKVAGVGNIQAATSRNKYGVKHNKYAVVIGISDYAPVSGEEGGPEDLWNPDKNAIEMKQALMEEYGYAEQNIYMLLNEQAKFEAIYQSIMWLASTTNEHSSVTFFYSGHGGSAPDLWGLDADVEDDGYDEGIISHDWVPISDGVLKEWFSYVQARKFSMIYDCCYSGGMFDDDDDLQAEGRVIVSACKADQLTYDVLEWNNTLFGYILIDLGILNGLAEVRRPGVSMEEAWAYAGPIVTEFTLPYGGIPGLTITEPQIYDGYSGQLIP